ncbi:MAG: UDP-glucose 4-epimerase GalE [Clostridia bacterium]|nr:UDP-glucose 4-epimerase GalE [Clostridia bacterium]
MKVLVTGGAGYIGSHTCLALLELGYDVVAVDNFCNSSPESLKRVEELTGKRVPLYELDVRDEAALDRVFQEHDIGCAIHFAGLKAVGESVEKPLSYYENNLLSTMTLLKVMSQNGVKRIIFSSSATVYSTENQMPLNETGRMGCSNPYGWTKFMCEEIIRDYVKADPAWSAVLLRYFNPVGAHPSGRIGEAPNGIPNNLMPFITQTACGVRQELVIFGDDYPTPDGTCIRDYIHVMDLAEGHAAAIDYLMAHTGTEVFNLGTGQGYSVLDMVKAFEEVNGLKLPHRIGPRRPGDIAVCYADPEKSRRLLHWSAKRTLKDMCADSWHWQEQNPRGYDA